MRILATISFLLAVTLSGAAEAAQFPRLVCDQQCTVATVAGWSGIGPVLCPVTARPRQLRLCHARLVRQCRKFGPDAVCPLPPPTTTTVPEPTTTTTSTTMTTSTTSTTLPTIPDIRGSYQLNGYVSSDNCGGTPGIGTASSFSFSVVTQSGANLGGVFGATGTPVTGQLYSDGSWNLSETDYWTGCNRMQSVAVNGVGRPTTGVVSLAEYCGAPSPCVVEVTGTVY
jgi:hypothetical protein